MKRSQLFRDGGFSLLQVMVAVGLMSGLAVMMMKMTENQAKSQKTMELKAEQGDVANIIRQTLLNKESCESSFVGMAPGDKVEALRMSSDMSQTPFALSGVKFKTYNVYIKEMALLTRAEEISFGQRDAGTKPIASYTTGLGTGYLRVVFAKNVGIVSDKNQTHNFFGAKETATIFQINGYFYDVEVVKHNDENKLIDSCRKKAQDNGVNCNGAVGEPCNLRKLNEDADMSTTDHIVDAQSGMTLYLGECKYFRDDSPFMGCM